jgi:Flp pilus assembly pilin Flp
MANLFSAVVRFARDENAQDLLEYGFLAVLIAIIVMAGVTALGVTINSVFWQSIASQSF